MRTRLPIVVALATAVTAAGLAACNPSSECDALGFAPRAARTGAAHSGTRRP